MIRLRPIIDPKTFDFQMAHDSGICLGKELKKDDHFQILDTPRECLGWGFGCTVIGDGSRDHGRVSWSLANDVDTGRESHLVRLAGKLITCAQISYYLKKRY
jgi:hypothetical protein